MCYSRCVYSERPFYSNRREDSQRNTDFVLLLLFSIYIYSQFIVIFAAFLQKLLARKSATKAHILEVKSCNDLSTKPSERLLLRK